MNKKLQRNEQNKMIAGVCSGLADYFSVDVSWVRAAFLLALVAGCSGGLIYLILWIAVPSGSIESIQGISSKTEKGVNSETISPDGAVKEKNGMGRVFWGLFLIVIGAFFLLDEFGFVPFWFDLGKLWPFVIIIPGILIIAKAKRRGI
ncbi:MAG: PspC domain-containing protein [Sphingobacteriaceae bacterium]|nr:MAG: PspC domain-containing protein [Pedobacter sp.]